MIYSMEPIQNPRCWLLLYLHRSYPRMVLDNLISHRKQLSTYAEVSVELNCKQISSINLKNQSNFHKTTEISVGFEKWHHARRTHTDISSKFFWSSVISVQTFTLIRLGWESSLSIVVFSLATSSKYSNKAYSTSETLDLTHTWTFELS